MKRILYASGLIFLGFMAACSGNSSNNSSQKGNPVTTSSTNVDTASSTASSPAASSGSAAVEKGNELFQANCTACHNVNQKLIGPALAGVTKIRSKQWIYNWVHNSSAVISSGDTAGVNLYKEYNQVQMTAFPNLTNNDIDDILAYINSQSNQ